MRIEKVVATNSQTKEKQTFVFDNSVNKGLLLSCGEVYSLVEFCFAENAVDNNDVEVLFTVQDNKFSLCKIHNEQGEIRTVLKKAEEGHWQVVARNENAFRLVQEMLQMSPEELIRSCYINGDDAENFHGNLRSFSHIKMFSDLKKEILQTNQKARLQKDNALLRVKQYAQNAQEPSIAPLEKVNSRLDEVCLKLSQERATLAQMQAQLNSPTVATLSAKLEETQSELDKLTSDKEMEQARQKILTRDSLSALATQITTLQSCKQQRAELEKQRFDIYSELEWKEKELADVVAQYREKQKQLAALQDKSNRIDAINTELAYIATLYSQNRTLNRLLQELEEKQKNLLSERSALVLKLESLEKSLGEIKAALDKFQVPTKSVGELMETVRVDVKIDEVAAQLSKLQSEVAVKESLIAEKESGLVVQMKKLHTVMDLDRAVTPIKAKDTILQVLETKYGKLESINASLTEKQRNLAKALDDYKYRIAQLENSRSKMEAERDKALLRKQEEFKREVFLNSQKMFTDDASSVFAVTTNFHDVEIETLDQEIAERSADRDLLVERAAQMEGAIKEIKRHIEINAAEMATLRGEKENINKRYNEIVAENNSEAVFNYLKALNSDTSTKYLLDVQQNAVRSEAELTEMKRYTDSLRSKVSDLRSRLKHLQDAQTQLDGTISSVDALISTNDRVKDSLNEIGDRLSIGYEQYISVCKQLEKVNDKLNSVNSAMTEAQKTVRVNDSQIKRSTAKAQQYAGDDDLEKAVANFNYDLSDVESEVQMLTESKQVLQKEVFERRLELGKVQWLYERESKQFESLSAKLQPQLEQMQLGDSVLEMDFSDNLDDLRQELAQYDARKGNLERDVGNYRDILEKVRGDVSTADIENKQREIDSLLQEQNNLEQQRTQLLQQFVAASTAKTKVTAAAAQAQTYSMLAQTLNHTDIVALLIDDKINTLLSVASQYVNLLTGGAYLLENNEGMVVLKIGKESVDYDQLPTPLKQAVYIALVLTVPNNNFPDGRCVFFDNIVTDKDKLSAMLSHIDGLHWAVETNKI